MISTIKKALLIFFSLLLSLFLLSCGQVNTKICSFVLNDGQYLTTSMTQSSKYDLLLEGNGVKVMEMQEEIAEITFLSEETYAKYWNNPEKIDGVTFLGKQLGKLQNYLLFQKDDDESLFAVYLVKDTDTGVKISGWVGEDEMKQIIDDLTIKAGNKKKI